jgi:hypothetical protein
MEENNRCLICSGPMVSHAIKQSGSWDDDGMVIRYCPKGCQGSGSKPESTTGREPLWQGS